MFAKGVANAIKEAKANGCCHGPHQNAAAARALATQPDSGNASIGAENTAGSSNGQAVSTAAASPGLSSEANGASSAAAGSSSSHAASCSAVLVAQGPAGQLSRPQGNPLPSRRAGPAARSHSRRALRDLGLGLVEEEGKVQVCSCLICCQTQTVCHSLSLSWQEVCSVIMWALCT